MLVLSRRKTESIIVGENIEIAITEVRGGSVQLGIIAPKSIPVHRKEVYEAIRNERKLKYKRYLSPSCGGYRAAAAGV